MRSSLVVAIATVALAGLFSRGFATDVSSKARYVGSISVPRTGAENGGFSGISLNTTGNRFLAITDRGSFFSGRLDRKDGTIKKIRFAKAKPLLDPEGNPVLDGQNDSEGLAVREDGRVFVSFEGPARVWTYRDTMSEAAWLPRHPSFKNLTPNGALEALAIAPDGALFSLAEGTTKHAKPHSVFRYQGNSWKLYSTIPRRGSYLPVGADFGPDGKFYVLERKFSAVSGFQSRIRRFELSNGGFGREDVIMESDYGDHSNLEGLSVWRNPLGEIRLTMISDDNFKFFLRSEIVEYSLTE